MSSREQEIFSYSVREDLMIAVMKKYNGLVSIEELLGELYNIHDKYAVNLFSDLLRFLNDSRIVKNRQPFEAWLNLALSGINQPHPDSGKVISGRMFLYSVLISSNLQVPGQLKNDWDILCRNVLAALRQEVLDEDNIDIESLLTDQGRKAVSAFYKEEADMEDLFNRDDMPSDEDLLSRDALSEYLAKRIRHIYRDKTYKGSFFIHIDGKWGSGKSTFLRFLKKHLTRGSWQRKADPEQSPWIIAEFNAWQNQRLDPPWWSILQSVYTTALRDLWKNRPLTAINFWLREQLWRLDKGRNFIVAAIVTLCMVIYAITTIYQKNNHTYITISKAAFEQLPFIKLVAGISGIVGLIWSSIGVVRESLVTGGAKSARAFIDQSSKDPMKDIEAHFCKMLKRMEQPLAIFIDDLDRCNKDYGIKLLEGLQTLFKDASVVYVIAADRKWLSTMYENNYAMFSGAVAQPGKAFGMIFMDKTFQLVVELPEMSASLKIAYWNSLLGIGGQARTEKLKAAAENADEKLKGLDSNKQILKAAEGEQDPVVAQKLREKALSKLSITQEDKFLENKLQKYLPLIDNNPRSMKRIINTLSIERAIKLLSNKAGIQDEELILWTILKMQYPLVSEYVWRYPEVLHMKEIHTCDDIAACAKMFPGYPAPANDFIMLYKNSVIRNLLSYELNSVPVTITSDFINIMKDGKELTPTTGQTANGQMAS